MSLRISLALLCAGAAWIAGSSGAAAQCPAASALGLRPGVVTVQTVVPAPQYRFDMSRSQLTRIMGQKGSNGGQHGTVLGLTYGTFNARWSIEASKVPVQGGYCHYLINADVRLEIPSLVVYIAKEYRRGSCHFQVINQHEQEHVRVNQYVVRKYAPIMTSRLNYFAARLLPVQSRNPSQTDEVERVLSPVLNKVLEEMYAERDRANAGLDSNYQYSITAQRCQNW